MIKHTCDGQSHVLYNMALTIIASESFSFRFLEYVSCHRFMLSRGQHSPHRSPSAFQRKRGWTWRNGTCAGPRICSCIFCILECLTGRAVEMTVGELRTRLSIVLSAVSGAPPLPLPAAIDTWNRKLRQPRSRWPNPYVFHNLWILRSLMLRTVFTAPIESQSIAVDSPTLDRLVGKCLWIGVRCIMRPRHAPSTLKTYVCYHIVSCPCKPLLGWEA